MINQLTKVFVGIFLIIVVFFLAIGFFSGVGLIPPIDGATEARGEHLVNNLNEVDPKIVQRIAAKLFDENFDDSFTGDFFRNRAVHYGIATDFNAEIGKIDNLFITNLDVSGDINANSITANAFFGDGSGITGISAVGDVNGQDINPHDINARTVDSNYFGIFRGTIDTALDANLTNLGISGRLWADDINGHVPYVGANQNIILASQSISGLHFTATGTVKGLLLHASRTEGGASVSIERTGAGGNPNQWDLFITNDGASVGNQAASLFLEPTDVNGDLIFRDFDNLITMQLDHSENDVYIPNGMLGITGKAKITSTGTDVALDIDSSSSNTLIEIDATGLSADDYAVHINANSGARGLYAASPNDIGIWGDGGSFIGIYGKSTSDAGVYDVSTSNIGVEGRSTSYVGVYGGSTEHYGTAGWSAESVGVYAKSYGGNAIYALGNYKGEPNVFAKVWQFDGTTTNDHTVEARSTGGTPFTLIADTDDYIYIGMPDNRFYMAHFELAVNGSYTGLDWEFRNASAWTDMTETGGALTSSGDMTWIDDDMANWTKYSLGASGENLSGAPDDTIRFWIRASASAVATTATANDVSLKKGNALEYFANYNDSSPSSYFTWYGDLNILDSGDINADGITANAFFGDGSGLTSVSAIADVNGEDINPQDINATKIQSIDFFGTFRGTIKAIIDANFSNIGTTDLYVSYLSATGDANFAGDVNFLNIGMTGGFSGLNAIGDANFVRLGITDVYASSLEVISDANFTRVQTTDAYVSRLEATGDANFTGDLNTARIGIGSAFLDYNGDAFVLTVG